MHCRLRISFHLHLRLAADLKGCDFAVHAQGSYLFLQIALLGRAGARAATQARNPDWDLVGPSDVPMPGGDVPRPMTEAEIKQQIQWMADAAKAFVEEAGGDGVESESRAGGCKLRPLAARFAC